METENSLLATNQFTGCLYVQQSEFSLHSRVNYDVLNFQLHGSSWNIKST